MKVLDIMLFGLFRRKKILECKIGCNIIEYTSDMAYSHIKQIYGPDRLQYLYNSRKIV